MEIAVTIIFLFKIYLFIMPGITTLKINKKKNDSFYGI